MKHLLDKVLHRYNSADLVTQMKARFFFLLCLAILFLMPIIITYTAYIELHNPILGYKINPAVILPETFAFIIFIFIIALIIRGHFVTSAHMILILLFATVWTVMFSDRSFIVSRLDTIVFLYCILAMTPLAVTGKGTSIIFYGLANMAMLVAYMLVMGDRLEMPRSSFLDYLADNSISFIALSIITYSIFAINRRALDRAEKEYGERRDTEDALRTSEKKYRLLTEASPEMIYLVDKNGVVQYVNTAAARMFNSPAESLAGRKLSELFSAEMAGRHLTAINEVIRTGRIYTTELIEEFQGRSIWIEARLSPVRDDSGSIIGVLGLSQDISERKSVEERIRTSLREKEVLLKEVHHRVKNNFQIIISLLNLQSNKIKDRDMLKRFSDSTTRIRAMALVHEKLYQSEDISEIDFASYINTISQEILLSYSFPAGKPKLIIDAEEIHLNLDQAIPCGLILNELLTNALKYAFPGGGSDKEISISLLMHPDGGIIFEVSDNGIGMPTDIDVDHAQTLGLQLVVLLIKQIHGTYTLDRSSGTKWHITAPSRGTSS